MVKEVDASTWTQDVMRSGKPVVVDFWHEQCPWCLRLNPVYEELANEYADTTFAKLNVRASAENTEIARKHGIMATPTIKVFCDGREVGEVIGFMEKAELKQEIDHILAHSETCLERTTAA